MLLIIVGIVIGLVLSCVLPLLMGVIACLAVPFLVKKEK
jgi:hypothetical protein